MISSPPAPALSNLAAEHRLISRVIDAVEVYADLLENSEAPVDDLLLVSDFLSGFTELVHHEKEEDILMSAMVQHGFSWDEGALERTRKEHEQERYLVQVLRQAARQDGGWSREDRRHAVASIRALIDFQRQHIEHEDTILYPAAVESLSAPELAELDRRLEEFDTVKVGMETLRSVVEKGDRLIAKYPPR